MASLTHSVIFTALLLTQNSFAAEGHGGEGAHNTVPGPDASAAKVPDSYKVEVFLSGLTFPTSIEFGTDGEVFMAESGYTYGDAKAIPRIIRYDKSGERKGEITEGLVGPINDLLWRKEIAEMKALIADLGDKD